MKVSEKEVVRLAVLSKLKFEADAQKSIQGDLNNIIDFIAELDSINTDGVKPLLFMTDEVNVLRADEANTNITQKEALKNAPQKDSDYFKIPKVLS